MIRREIVALVLATTAFSGVEAFEVQGHRGARGLAPENTIEGFKVALALGVTTLELDLAMTQDGVLVVSHDSRLNPDHTRAPGGRFLEAQGPTIHSLTFAELQRYDVGRLKPGSDYVKRFPEQRGVDGVRIPALTQVFDLARGDDAKDIRFNIETKLTPTSGTDTPDPETFAQAIADVVRAEKLAPRVSVQSFDWRTLMAMKRIAPEIERVCLTVEADWEDSLARGKPGPSPWTAGLDIDDVGGSAPKLAAAAGCAVWSPYYRNVSEAAIAEAKAAGVTVIPWTVNEPADMERLIGLGVDGIITDYPDRLRRIMTARGMPLPKPATVK